MIQAIHMGRSWVGTQIEDRCPCPQAPCGLVISDRRDPHCAQHTNDQSIRQQHMAGDCPGHARIECAASISGFCLAETQGETSCDTDGHECAHAGRMAQEDVT